MSVFLVLLGYACGTFPTAALLARRAGVDIRTAGSGNPGATNVARSAGLGPGIATLALDLLKGAAPTMLAAFAVPGGGTAAWVGLAAVLGHTLPFFDPLRGGKGVATALGVLLVLDPRAAAVAVLAFLILALASRRVSLGSIGGAIAAATTAAVDGSPRPVAIATAAIAAIVCLRHRVNVVRLLTGAEPAFVLHKGQAPPNK